MRLEVIVKSEEVDKPVYNPSVAHSDNSLYLRQHSMKGDDKN